MQTGPPWCSHSSPVSDNFLRVVSLSFSFSFSFSSSCSSSRHARRGLRIFAPSHMYVDVHNACFYIVFSSDAHISSLTHARTRPVLRLNPAWPLQKDIVAIVFDPQLGRVPRRTHVDSHDDGYAPNPNIVGLAPCLAFAKSVDIVVGLKERTVHQYELHMIYVVKDNVGVYVWIVTPQIRGHCTLHSLHKGNSSQTACQSALACARCPT